MVKKRQLPSESESDSPEEQYVVELISAAKVNEEGIWEYFVKWAGYSSDSNSWEPEENVQGCDRLLGSFWKNIGIDEEDYPPGYTVKATPDWIAREKRFFKKTFGKASTRVAIETIADSSESEDDHKAKRVKHAEPPASSSARGGGREEKDRQSKARSKGKGKADDGRKAGKGAPKDRSKRKEKAAMTGKGKGKEKEISPESSGSESDAPLQISGKKRPRVPSAQSSDGDEPLRKSAKVKEKPKPSKSADSVGKAKERAKPRSPPRQSSPGNESTNSLFSEPSSPDLALSSLPAASGSAAASNPTPLPPPAIEKADERKKPERRGIKLMPLQIKDNSGAVPIRTKARLAARGDTDPAVQLQQQQQQKKNSLVGLSFKRNTATTGSNASTPTVESPAVRFPPSVSTGPLRIDTQVPITGVTEFAQSPASFHSDADISLPGSSKQSRMPLPRRTSTPSYMSPAQPAAPSPMTFESETDRFLASIMPPELAAPLAEPDPSATPQSPQVLSNVPAISRAAQAKVTAVTKIPKKWKWTGELFVDVGPGKADLLCNVSLFDPSMPRPGGYRLDICLPHSTNSLRFRKMHEYADIYMLLRTCGAVQQFARVDRAGEGDADAFHTLADYMARKRMFTHAELQLGDAAVAYLLVFPTASERLRTLLQVPLDLVTNSSLLAAVLPWDLTSREYAQGRWRKPRSAAPALELADPPRPLLQHTALHRAIHMLRFPKTLFEYMAQPDRPYCIWHPNDGTAARPGADTVWLRTVLGCCRSASDAGYKRDVRVVFVHVGALALLRDLPALAERRQKLYGLRFYTYGTHHTVPPERWGVRLVYPHGGVVTFTPSAIYQDLRGATQLMQKLNAHPLWCAYLLPTTVALLAQLTSQGQSALDAYDKGEFVFDDVLQMIDDGELSLLRAPPQSRQPHGDNDARMKWVQWQLRLACSDKRAVLQQCVDAGRALDGKDPEKAQAALEEQVAADLQNMMLQPAIMDEHRRFVVVFGGDDRVLVRDQRGIECTRVSGFNFRDNYFQEEP